MRSGEPDPGPAWVLYPEPVTRDVTRLLAAATTLASLTAVAGCGSSADKDRGSAPAATPGTPSAASITVRPQTPATTSGPPGVPTPGSLAEPATSSGALSKRSFPTPRQLGPGWAYSVDPGSAEEGYAGNGTPALARNPQEIVQTAVPFGCEHRTRLPVPVHALEVDYRLDGAKVIAVRGRFAGPAGARAFFRGRSADLTACVGRSGGAAIGPLVAALSTPAPDAVASDRTPRSDPWREVAVLDGDSVALLAARGAHPLTDAQTRRLVRLFRS